MIHRFPPLLLSILLLVALVGCAAGSTKSSSAAPAVNKAYVTVPAKLRGEIACPICGEPVTTSDPNAWYGVFPVYCHSINETRQFAALPKDQRAKLAAPQVLPQKRIANSICPLTDETLTAAATPVLYDETIIGFASLSDANQFNSLPAKKKKECIEAWRAKSGA